MFCNNVRTTQRLTVPKHLLPHDTKYGLDGILNNKREDEWFFEFFKKNDINYIDTSIMFTRYIRNNGTMINLFVEDGNYNDKGDSLVAASIKNYFNQSSKNNSLIR